MSASSRARVLLQHCSRAGERTAAPLSQRSCLRRVPLVATVGRLAGREKGLFRTRPSVGWSLMQARYSSSEVSGGEQPGSSAASETSESSGGESTAASSLSAEESAAPEPTPEPKPVKDAPVGKTPPNFAFAFDIDGVLLHSSKPLPGAAESLRYLQQHRIPFILLTNGGGKPEAERVAELSSKLGVNLDTSNFVQSHTPFQILADEPPPARKPPKPETPGSALPFPHIPSRQSILASNHLTALLKRDFQLKTLRDSTVLVLGSDASKARHIAHGYGFKSVVTPGDILKACPQIFPFHHLHEFYDKQEILPLPKPIYSPENPQVRLEDCLKITAILVFNDPRDWAVDIQLITDLMFSDRGYLGTSISKSEDPQSSPQKQVQQDGRPLLIFSNGDLLWSTGYHLSRFGQGAFRAALMAALLAVEERRGAPLGSQRGLRWKFKTSHFGKPNIPTYMYAERVLLQYHWALWQQQQLSPGDAESEGALGHGRQPQPPPHIENIFMVGDNPESDISGANTRMKSTAKVREKEPTSNPRWTSCLVKTGVWNEKDTPLEHLRGSWKPDIVRDDVRDTVNWALEQQGWPGRVEDGHEDGQM